MAIERLHAAFQRAATSVPAYRRLLEEHGVDPATIVDYEAFTARCPILTKANTFDRFPIDQLCAEGAMRDLADVLTSSGHGGRFSFGLSTRRQQAEAPAMIDYALDDAFGISHRRTLVINCLPMGVGFSSASATVATTSVREDMATALVTTFGSHYDQIIIVTDPLFVRRLLDYARERGVDWRRYRLGLVIGEEIFGEHFRSYVAERFGLDVEQPENGYLMSSFGVGELGLHLCFETPATIAVRRAAACDAELAHELFGDFAALPMVFAYNPLRTLMESVEPDSSGYGRLTISMLDTSVPVPLLRYQTGDVVRLLDSQRIAALLKARGVVPAWSAAGRDAGAGGAGQGEAPWRLACGRLQGRTLFGSRSRRSSDRRLSRHPSRARLRCRTRAARTRSADGPAIRGATSSCPGDCTRGGPYRDLELRRVSRTGWDSITSGSLRTTCRERRRSSRSEPRRVRAEASRASRPGTSAHSEESCPARAPGTRARRSRHRRDCGRCRRVRATVRAA